MDFLKGCALLLSAYGCWGVFTGSVWAKDGISAREIHKQDQPGTFWVVCLCYIFIGGFLYYAMEVRFG